ncbi:MAG: hypothetical protein ACWIPH_07670 [Ostreibacterium sp.]
MTESIIDKHNITADNLPLSVREPLMRGQYEMAVDVLVIEYDKTTNEAENLIESYRASLRERKISLDLQIIREKDGLETNEKRQSIIKWGGRGLLAVIVLIIVYLLGTFFQ